MEKKLSAFLILFLFLPSGLLAKSLYVKLSFGAVSGGGIEDSLRPGEFSRFAAVTHDPNPRIGQEVFLELIYKFNRYLGFSLGNGYISKKMNGQTFEYSPPIMPPELEQVFEVHPSFSMEAIPICLSSHLSLPLGSSFELNVMGGIGFYFIKLESVTKWYTVYRTMGPSYTDTWNFRGKSNDFGYHLGAGLDFDLSLNLFLSVQAVYRFAGLKHIRSEEISERLTTAFYLDQIMGEDFSEEYNYHISELSLTGFSFWIGLKFRF